MRMMSSESLPVLLLVQVLLMQLPATGAVQQQPQQPQPQPQHRYANHHNNTSDDAGDPAAALQRQIDAAIAAKDDSLSIPAGDYRFGNRTLIIQDATDLVIQAAGPVTIWFSNHHGGFVLRRCTNVSILGAGPGQPLRLDRSPPPWSQGTVTSAGSGSFFEFTLDGDSADPRTMQPVGYNGGMIGPECTAWTKGARASDHKDRPWSRGLPDSKAACFDNTKLTELGARHFRAPVLNSKRGGAPAVGDQFVMYAWKGMTYVVANSSAVLTQVRMLQLYWQCRRTPPPLPVIEIATVCALPTAAEHTLSCRRS
jgi:hypothetical protein